MSNSVSKKSFVGKLTERFSEPAEKSAAEIDRELAAAVEAIRTEKVEILAGKKVLKGSAGAAGGKVYIMDLKPIYGLIGGSKGRVAEHLREACHKEFAERGVKGRDQATLEGDLFVMRFAGIGDQEGFKRAATIVNTIGMDLLGSRFETLEVPDLLVATSADVAFNPDGSANPDALRAAVESGGAPVSMDEPDDDAPHWIKLRWKEEARKFQLRTQEFQAKAEAARRSTRRPGDYAKRRIGDRRGQTKLFKGGDKRKILDRRGRGY